MSNDYYCVCCGNKIDISDDEISCDVCKETFALSKLKPHKKVMVNETSNDKA